MSRRRTLGLFGLVASAVAAIASKRTLDGWGDADAHWSRQSMRFPDGVEASIVLPDGAEIMTERVGDGPLIVLVHGLTASRHDWCLVAPKLVEAGFSVLAVDQRGHGESTVGTAGFGSRQLGRDLRHVLDHLQLEPVCLAGHSMGGMALMGLAADDLDRFNQQIPTVALIATDSALDTLRHQVALRLGGLPLVPDRRVGPRALSRLVAGLGFFGSDPPMTQVDTVIDNYFDGRADANRQATVALVAHDLDHVAERLLMPVLVVGASRDLLISPSQVRELAERIPKARLQMFDDAGHLVIWEHATDIAQSIVELASPIAMARSGSEDQPLHDPT